MKPLLIATPLMATLTLGLSADLVIADKKTASTPAIGKKVTIAGARRAAGPAIGAASGKVLGDTAGRVIGKAAGGGPIGLGLGILLSPTRIGCGPGETCAQTKGLCSSCHQ